jgi:hypothetical protein
MTTDFRDDYDQSTKGAIIEGTSALAGCVLLISGITDVLQGIAAIDGGDIYLRRFEYMYDFNLTAWGWLHIVIGAACVIAAIGIFRRAPWGQLTGIIVATLSILTNFAFLPHFPLWSILVIAFDVLVIWALCTQFARRR